MRKKFPVLLISIALLIPMPAASLAQSAARNQAIAKIDAMSFLYDVADGAAPKDGAFQSEARKIATILIRDLRKSPILIDATGNNRELVVQAAADQLATRSPEKRIVGIDWNGLLSNVANESEADLALADILHEAELSGGTMILYIDDVAAFAKHRPLLGEKISSQLYNAIATGKVRILTGTTPEQFLDQISSDAKLKGRFARIDINDAGPFVGDKVSPDLRKLVGSDAAGAKHFDNLIKPDVVVLGNWLVGARSPNNEIIHVNSELASTITTKTSSAIPRTPRRTESLSLET